MFGGGSMLAKVVKLAAFIVSSARNGAVQLQVKTQWRKKKPTVVGCLVS